MNDNTSATPAPSSGSAPKLPDLTSSFVVSDESRNEAAIIGPAEEFFAQYGLLTPESPLGESLYSSQVDGDETFRILPYGFYFVGEDGRLSVDILFDGGGFAGGQLVAFAITGMDSLAPSSTAFIQEAAIRGASNSVQGYVLFDDGTEAAKYSGKLGNTDSQDFNQGDYQGVKEFQFEPGTLIAFMLIPNGTVEDVLENPGVEGDKQPLFSFATANPNNTSQFGQVVGSDSNVLFWEDLPVGQEADPEKGLLQGDQDYNDLIVRVGGVVGFLPSVEENINPLNNWLTTSLGQEILNITEQNPSSSKPQPGIPVIDPVLPTPSIPETAVDQGSNEAVNPTPLTPSEAVDVVDQVSDADPVDRFILDSEGISEVEVEVLTGQAEVTVTSEEGEVIQTDTFARGETTIDLPDEVTGNVTVEISVAEDTPTSYIISDVVAEVEDPFNIEADLGDDFTETQRLVIQQAVQRVEALIVQGLPSVVFNGEIIDDLKIRFVLDDLDGTGGTLGTTQLNHLRLNSLLPGLATVRVDQADINQLEQSGELLDVVTHELLHALGIGTLWTAKGLIEFEGTSASRYIGEEGVKAFQDAGGLTGSIPLDNTTAGSADKHWHEDLFRNELMTRDLSAGNGSALLSIITLASFIDLGYEVDLDAASSEFSLFESLPPALAEEDLSIDEVRQQLQEFIEEAEAHIDSGIPAVLPAIDPTSLNPNPKAFAERFDGNGEYYNWVPYVVQSGDTLSAISLDTMGSSALSYYSWIAEHNAIPNPDYIVAGDLIEVPVLVPNYEQIQEEKRQQREEELRQQEEEKQRERERREAVFQEAGEGGREWFLATEMPEFANDGGTYETSVRDVVGPLVPDDFYSFTLTREGLVTASLEDILGDVDLRIFNSRNELVAESSRDGVTDEKIVLNLAAGTYNVHVYSGADVTSEYNLKLKYQGTLTRTQQGPPPGWRVGGGRSSGGNGSSSGGGRSSATFSDPRIKRLFTTAVDQFTQEKRAEAQPEIDRLAAEKRAKEQEADRIVAEAVAQQKENVNRQLDGVRSNLQSGISSVTGSITAGIDGVASWGFGLVDGAIPGWLWDTLDFVGLDDDVQRGLDGLKGSIDGARDWLNDKVDWAQGQIDGAVSQFIETVKAAYVTGAEINDVIQRAAEQLNAKVDEMANFLGAKVAEFKGQIAGAMQWTRNVAIPGWATSWPLNLPEWNLYDHVVAGIVDDVADSAFGTIRSASGFLKEAVTGAKSLAQGAVASILDQLLGDKTGKIYNEVNGINAEIASIQRGVTNAIATQTQIYKNLLDGLLSGLGQAGSFIVGALMGEFNGEASIWQVLLDTAIGMIPIAGEIGDVRDLIAFAAKFINDPSEMEDPWNWVGVAGAGLGLIPVFGGALKGVTKLARSGDMVAEIRKLGPAIGGAIADFARKADWKSLSKSTVDLFDSSLSTVDDLLELLGEKIDEFKRLPEQFLQQLAPVEGYLPDRRTFEDWRDGISELRRKAPEKIEEGFAFVQRKVDEFLGISPGKLVGSPPFSQDEIRKFVDETENLGEGHIYSRHVSTGDSVDDQRKLQQRLQERLEWLAENNKPREQIEYSQNEFSMFWSKESAIEVTTQAVNSRFSDIEDHVKASVAKGKKLESKGFTVPVSSSDTAFGINWLGEYIESDLDEIRLVIQPRKDGTWFVLSSYPIIL